MRASHSSWRVNVRRRHQRRLVEQPRAVARVELHDLELVRRRRPSARSWRTRGARGRCARASRAGASRTASRRRTARPTRRRVAARASSSRSRAISLPCSRVTSRWRWQNAASRTASRSISARHRRRQPLDDLGAEPAPLVPGRDEVVLGVRRRRSSSAIARTTLDVLLVQRRVDHHRRVDRRLGAPPRGDRGVAVRARASALRRSRC